MIDVSDWSPTLQRCARAVGTLKTLRLVRICGGCEKVYIPINPHAGHAWALALGLGDFELLAREFGGERITLPLLSSMTNKKAIILSLLEEGLSSSEIARRVRTTPRYVRHVAALVRFE